MVAAVGSVNHPKVDVTMKSELHVPRLKNLHEECLRVELVRAIGFAASLPPGVSELPGFLGFPAGPCQPSYAPTPEVSTKEACCTGCEFHESQAVSFDWLQILNKDD